LLNPGLLLLQRCLLLLHLLLHKAKDRLNVDINMRGRRVGTKALDIMDAPAEVDVVE
jgi:hypothetical protein